ncbi:MAG: hypothetical protein LBG67_02930 [Campylobacteraceae bacterium]|jgi:hypothetical protein|nr:hypothetical protein [Campylobacteraceae bacterium]
MKKFIFGSLTVFIALAIFSGCESKTKEGPYEGMTRNEAIAMSIKNDVTAATLVVPAWYTGQKDARISEAMSIDTSRWSAIDDSGYGFVYKDGGKECVTMQIYEVNDSGEVKATSKNIKENGQWQPLQEKSPPAIKISKGNSNGAACRILWNDFGLKEQTISMGGNRVSWSD